MVQAKHFPIPISEAYNFCFLFQELTEKGLKKLGHSIEVSYSNVQRLVLKYLHTGSQVWSLLSLACVFHLAFLLVNLVCGNILKKTISSFSFTLQYFTMRSVLK